MILLKFDETKILSNGSLVLNILEYRGFKVAILKSFVINVFLFTQFVQRMCQSVAQKLV